jgi:glycosyltransferase involved in cell wall biosynthesis
MKIAFVYDAIYPWVKGGIEKRVWELAVRLIRNGHEVHLFGMKFWGGEDILIIDGVVLHGVCPAQKLYSDGRRSIWQALYFSIHLISPLMKDKFDIIDCQQFPFFSCFSVKIISILKKIPMVITWHEIWGDYWYDYIGWKGCIGKITERLVARLTSDNIAVSKTTAKNMGNLGIRPPIKIIPNGVDLLNIKTIHPSLQTSDIIFAGRLIKEKHVDMLLQAFSLLLPENPDYVLVIIGDGPERNAVLSMIKKLSMMDRVRFFGSLESHDEILSHMKSSKVCVLPSTREGFGIAALEALACGLPVITVDHKANAVCDLITENNGFRCSLSVNDLAATICRGLSNHAEMRNACIESAVLSDWNRITLDIESYYKSVISSKKTDVRLGSRIKNFVL